VDPWKKQNNAAGSRRQLPSKTLDRDRGAILRTAGKPLRMVAANDR
jgi:hypothetical protein